MNLIQDYTEDNSSNTSEEDTKELQELLGMNKINPTPKVALVVPHSQQIDSLNKVRKKIFSTFFFSILFHSRKKIKMSSNFRLER